MAKSEIKSKVLSMNPYVKIKISKGNLKHKDGAIEFWATDVGNFLYKQLIPIILFLRRVT